MNIEKTEVISKVKKYNTIKNEDYENKIQVSNTNNNNANSICPPYH
jgi:hypothetical protein